MTYNVSRGIFLSTLFLELILMDLRSRLLISAKILFWLMNSLLLNNIFIAISLLLIIWVEVVRHWKYFYFISTIFFLLSKISCFEWLLYWFNIIIIKSIPIIQFHLIVFHMLLISMLYIISNFRFNFSFSFLRKIVLLLTILV